MSDKIVNNEQYPVDSKKPEEYFFRASAADFKKISGSPIAYWSGETIRRSFEKGISLGKLAMPRQGMATTNNALFVRKWFEVTNDNTYYNSNSECEALESGLKWFPYNKGGDYRKWFGNGEHLVNYENSGQTICDYIDNTPGAKVGSNGRVINRDKYFKPSVTWSFISSAYFGVRYSPAGFIFDVAGSSVFPERDNVFQLTGFLCSKLATKFLSILNPTLNFQVGNISALPILPEIMEASSALPQKLVTISKSDWDTYETSWDFTQLPLLSGQWLVDSGEQEKLPTPHYPLNTRISAAYAKLRTHWAGMTMKMQQLEEENNRIFIEAYGLQDELKPEVSLKEITLTCNPYYRYGGKKNEVELEGLLLADTMKEFISYAVGCMFGRYSLDKEGLILANQGETLEDYYKKVGSEKCEVRSKNSPLSTSHSPLGEARFAPDDDNVIPILDGEWFTDDVTERFRRFVKVTFGEEHYQENLAFIEQSIGKDIRKYFLKDFYVDHVKRYKKRPIYWMFSSPKGSFNALIYMHRYQPTTASVVLNGYLREFRTKLIARKEHLEQVSISASVSQRDKTQALKEIEKLKKMIDELESWERDVLYPLAAEQIEIDLDDGVKVNYPKFGKALKKVVGLS